MMCQQHLTLDTYPVAQLSAGWPGSPGHLVTHLHFDKSRTLKDVFDFFSLDNTLPYAKHFLPLVVHGKKPLAEEAELRVKIVERPQVKPPILTLVSSGIKDMLWAEVAGLGLQP